MSAYPEAVQLMVTKYQKDLESGRVSADMVFRLYSFGESYRYKFVRCMRSGAPDGMQACFEYSHPMLAGVATVETAMKLAEQKSTSYLIHKSYISVNISVQRLLL